MPVNIHPYKGYLNTPFNFYVKGSDEVTYKIVKEGEDNETKQGKLKPNIPFSLKFEKPGNYNINFSDGTDPITLQVIDGLKFGGSSFKNAFIFDECPWAIIVMYDRTYFYNRETQENYVEAISPDHIREVGTDYILLENDDYEDKILYSLIGQKPVLNFSGEVIFNQKIIIEVIETNNKPLIKMFSLKDFSLVHQLKVDYYYLTSNLKTLFYFDNNEIGQIDLDENNEIIMILQRHGVIPISIIDDKIIVTFDKKFNKLYFYKINDETLFTTLSIKNNLAGVNGKEMINVYKRKEAIQKFDFNETDFPDASIQGVYIDLEFFVTDWDIYYIEHKKTLYKDENIRYVKTESEYVLKTCKNAISIRLKSKLNRVKTNDSILCLKGKTESFIATETQKEGDYSATGIISQYNSCLILNSTEGLKVLDTNGQWGRKIEDDFNLQFFEDYGIVEQKKAGIYRSLTQNVKGRRINKVNYPIEYLEIDDKIVVKKENEWRYKSNMPSFPPNIKAISRNLKSFIFFKNSKPYLGYVEGMNIIEEKILSDIFDKTSFSHVLMSPDGKNLLFRESSNVNVLDILSGEISSFPNTQYVEQINGIRPFFELDKNITEKSRQVKIINPTTGKLIPPYLLQEFAFVSPDYTLFAENKLSSYEYYFDWLSEKDISYEEGEKIKNDLGWKFPYNFENPKNKEILEKRKEIIASHYSEFIRRAHNHHWSRETDEKIIAVFTNKYNISIENNNELFELLLEKRGFAVIKKIEDSSEVARIELGPALWYLNYVSFSFDSRYVCIGGRYPNTSHYGGLFLIYDLEERKILMKKTDTYAIWTTSFNKRGMIAAYSSDPNLYFDISENHYSNEPEIIIGRSFLTFSSDGKYLALSNQGYIAKNKKDGRVRSEWGHMETTDVFIHKSSNITKEVMRFKDLSEVGIENLWDKKRGQRETVASVSFSNDNKKLMMVGKDGVVIIRNLHLEEDANE